MCLLRLGDMKLEEHDGEEQIRLLQERLILVTNDVWVCYRDRKKYQTTITYRLNAGHHTRSVTASYPAGTGVDAA
ncbi:hypothetical protein C8R32_104145 [Nitrosospira sp. Nsp5]|uniref:Uncharacterized protein n=1 Tax=Nitrosospira multiformis TaxID=1231 RepID=A0ABY0TF20_9PROT|nr:hypothetical protein C8R32_104145 [Nitrosospira sp. Nsp5]SDQ70169.1 hypothetical protein SAMN05216402_1925 [Nitrosospira multiformis]